MQNHSSLYHIPTEQWKGFCRPRILGRYCWLCWWLYRWGDWLFIHHRMPSRTLTWVKVTPFGSETKLNYLWSFSCHLLIAGCSHSWQQTQHFSERFKHLPTSKSGYSSCTSTISNGEEPQQEGSAIFGGVLMQVMPCAMLMLTINIYRSSRSQPVQKNLTGEYGISTIILWIHTLIINSNGKQDRRSTSIHMGKKVWKSLVPPFDHRHPGKLGCNLVNIV